jgi:uncharacterized glyoxalase superfamily protein PhnB
MKGPRVYVVCPLSGGIRRVYQSVFGGELTLSTFGEFHASEDPAEQDKIMHGMLVSDSGLTLMGADTPNSMEYTPGDSYSVSLSGEDRQSCIATGRGSRRGHRRDAAQEGSVGRHLRSVR